MDAENDREMFHNKTDKEAFNFCVNKLDEGNFIIAEEEKVGGTVNLLERLMKMSLGGVLVVLGIFCVAFYKMLTYTVIYPGFRLVFGTLYPAYSSYKAVKSKNVKEYVKWMMYWIVFALFTSVETVTDVFLSWFPFYYEIKIILVIWLLSPATKGSSFLYRKFVHPMLSNREQEIDEYISKAKEQSYKQVLELGSVGVSALMRTALKGGGGLVNQIRKSYSLSDLSIQSPDEIDTRLRKRQSPRRTPSTSMYFSEIDVRTDAITSVQSVEDVSSGYSSGEVQKLPSSGPLIRSGSIGSTKVRPTRVTRSVIVPRRTMATPAAALPPADDCDDDVDDGGGDDIIFLNGKAEHISQLNSEENSNSEEEEFVDTLEEFAGKIHEAAQASGKSTGEIFEEFLKNIKGQVEIGGEAMRDSVQKDVQEKLKEVEESLKNVKESLDVSSALKNAKIEDEKSTISDKDDVTFTFVLKPNNKSCESEVDLKESTESEKEEKGNGIETEELIKEESDEDIFNDVNSEIDVVTLSSNNKALPFESNDDTTKITSNNEPLNDNIQNDDESTNQQTYDQNHKNERSGRYNKKTAPEPPPKQDLLNEEDLSSATVTKATLVLKPGILKPTASSENIFCHSPILVRKPSRRSHSRSRTHSRSPSPSPVPSSNASPKPKKKQSAITKLMMLPRKMGFGGDKKKEKLASGGSLISLRSAKERSESPGPAKRRSHLF